MGGLVVGCLCHLFSIKRHFDQAVAGGLEDHVPFFLQLQREGSEQLQAAARAILRWLGFECNDRGPARPATGGGASAPANSANNAIAAASNASADPQPSPGVAEPAAPDEGNAEVPRCCAACGTLEGVAGVGKLKSCSKCHSVRYCSAECQKAHWRAHKPACSAAQEQYLASSTV